MGTTVTDMGSSSVSITTIDSLEKLSAPWRKQDSDDESDMEEEIQEEVEEEEELPGMSLKKSALKTTVVSVVDPKERKQINRSAVRALHSSKAFKAQERLLGKKKSTKARFSRGKKLKKKRDRIHHPKK